MLQAIIGQEAARAVTLAGSYRLEKQDTKKQYLQYSISVNHTKKKTIFSLSIELEAAQAANLAGIKYTQMAKRLRELPILPVTTI